MYTFPVRLATEIVQRSAIAYKDDRRNTRGYSGFKKLVSALAGQEGNKCLWLLSEFPSSEPLRAPSPCAHEKVVSRPLHGQDPSGG